MLDLRSPARVNSGVGTEIEIKFRLDDPAGLRRRLEGLSAVDCGGVLEENTFLDTPDAALRRQDCGLRLRINHRADGTRAAVLTFKGPRQPGDMKIRSEHETSVDPPETAIHILRSLGFAEQLTFQKRRQTYQLAAVEVVIDELPELGFFVEIEGPTEQDVRAAAKQLGLAGQSIRESYSYLVADYLQSRGGGKALRF